MSASDGEDWLDPDAAVDGGSINWGRVTSVVLGGAFLAWVNGATELLGFYIGGAVSALAGLFEYGATVVSQLFDVPTGVMSAAWNAVAEFVAGFGPVALPIAMVLTLATLFVLLRGTEEVFSQ